MGQDRFKSTILVRYLIDLMINLVGIYDVSMNPDYIEGRKTREQILTEFLSNFEGVKGNRDGIVTRDEFFDYYTDLSMSVPSDEYFVRMMESTW